MTNTQIPILDLGATLMVLRRGWRLLLSLMVLAAVATTAIMTMVPPRFEAGATIVLETEAPQEILSDKASPPERFAKDRLKNEIAVLQADEMAGRVAEKLQLERHPAFGGGPTNLLAVLLGGGSDDQDLARIRRDLRSMMRFTPVEGSRVIRISATTGWPSLSAEIANAYADVYLDGRLEAKLKANRTAYAWLQNRVDTLRSRVEAAENAVAAARETLSFAEGQSLSITQAQLRELTSTVSAARNETARLRGTHERLAQAVASGEDLSAIDAFRNASVLRKLRFEEGNLLTKRANALQNRIAAQVDFQLKDIRQKIEVEIGRIVAAAKVTYEAAAAQDAALTANLRSVETRALEQSRSALKVRQLEREADASGALYESYLARLAELAEQEALETPDARLVGRAIKPGRGNLLRMPIALGAAVILALMAGILILIIREKLDRSFRSAPDVERRTGLPVLGSIPRLGNRHTRSDVVRAFKGLPNGSLSEAIRTLRTAVTAKAAPPKVLLFTSSAPAEGKSTTAMLTAMAAQAVGVRTILVDCDLRRPVVEGLVATTGSGPGLVAVLEGRASPEQAIATDRETGIDALLVRGGEARLDRNAADLLSSHAMGSLLAELRGNYDLVILDTPPVLAVSDARILAPLSDTILFAIRWGETPEGAVQEALAELADHKDRVRGVVLTMMDEAKAGAYASHNYGSYRARYQAAYTG